MPEPTDKPDSTGLSPRRRLAHALAIFAATTAACVILWQLRAFLPLVARHLHTMIAVLFLYVPTWLVGRRREDFADYALTARPVARGLTVFAVASAVVFPLFAVGTFFYYRVVCGWAGAGVWVPRSYRRLCRRFVPRPSAIRWRWPRDYAEVALAQLVVVALPEEYFFRGYLQTDLDRVWPPRRRLLGAPVGWSLPLTSALFALAHVLVDLNGLRLAVFFPALAFGWMRQLTGSILAGVLFHAACNLISELVHTQLFS